MTVRIARGAGASAMLFAALAAAQSPTPLPPQNYGAQPGFFRSATEMAAVAGANPGVMPATPPQAMPQPVAMAPAAAPVVAPQASTVVVAPEHVADPTQNLQWERQMDRVESAAAQQRQQAQATPPPVAPGAYNGSTNPADR
jgi:hypothetical protein